MDNTLTNIWRQINFDTELPFNRNAFILVTIFPDENPEAKIQIVYRMYIYIEEELERYMPCFRTTKPTGITTQNFDLPWKMFTSGIFIRLLSLLRRESSEQVSRCYTLIFHHFEDFLFTEAGIKMSKEAGFDDKPLRFIKTGSDTYHLCATLNHAGTYTVEGNQIEGNAYGHITCLKKDKCNFRTKNEMGKYFAQITNAYIKSIKESNGPLYTCIKTQTAFFNTMMEKVEKEGLITFKDVAEN